MEKVSVSAMGKIGVLATGTIGKVGVSAMEKLGKVGVSTIGKNKGRCCCKEK